MIATTAKWIETPKLFARCCINGEQH